MVPIALERAIGLERLSPLAVVVIGGLLVSTFLTLLYVPIFYSLFEDLRASVVRWATRLRERRTKSPEIPSHLAEVPPSPEASER